MSVSRLLSVSMLKTAPGPAARNFLMLMGGTLVLAVSSQVQIPMVPVPVTMQTLAVTMVGALLGRKLGTATVLAWLAQAAMGLPVLAGGAGGMQVFAGPTAGYLAAFPVMAFMVGWLADKGWSGSHPLRAFASMLGANVLCLALGGAWLATLMDAEHAIALGVTPFLVGAVLKSALGAALLAAGTRYERRKA